MLKRSVAANFAGQGYTAVLSLALVPVYLHALGVEAYGLVGFFTSLQALLGVLDFGLSTTANREVAQRAAVGRQGSVGSIVRTLEVTYAAVGAAIALVLVALSRPLAAGWFHLERLSVGEVQAAVAIVGVTIGLRWPVSMYTGVLRGLEHHVAINQINAGVATVRGVGAVLVLFLVSRTVAAFLVWQLAVAAIEVATLAALAWRRLPVAADEPRRFEYAVLRSTWRFSGGVALTAIFAAILKQLDKVLISKLLPLEALGYYTTAATISANLALFVAPITSAMFPRLSALTAQGETAALARVYHHAARVTAMMVAPAAGLLMAFPHDVLRIWTQSADVADRAAPALAVLGYATLLNSMMHLPYSLQLSAGLTRIAAWNNGVSVLVLVPLLYVLIPRFDIVGGALGWALFNTSYFLLVPRVMHRRVLPGHLRTWVFRDTLPFMAVSAAAFGAARLLSDYLGGGPAFYGAVLVAATVYGATVLTVFRDDVPVFFRLRPEASHP